MPQIGSFKIGLFGKFRTSKKPMHYYKPSERVREALKLH
jgi:hypothetical protein